VLGQWRTTRSPRSVAVLEGLPKGGTGKISGVIPPDFIEKSDDDAQTP
jgi:hypothetical protein